MILTEEEREQRIEAALEMLENPAGFDRRQLWWIRHLAYWGGAMSTVQGRIIADLYVLKHLVNRKKTLFE